MENSNERTRLLADEWQIKKYLLTTIINCVRFVNTQTDVFLDSNSAYMFIVGQQQLK